MSQNMTTEHFSHWSTDEYGDSMVSCSCGWGTAHGLPTVETAADSWGDHMYDSGFLEVKRTISPAEIDTEEMRAIKAVLRHLAVRQATEVQAPTVDVLRLLGLPDITIEWVMS